MEKTTTYKTSIFVKLLGIALVGYSLVAGMLIPLGSGVIDVNSREVKGGTELILEVKTYNTKATETQQAIKEARIRLNPSQAICAHKIEPLNLQDIKLYFDIPVGKLPIQDTTEKGERSPYPLLEIATNNNGVSSLKSVVFLRDSLVPGADPTESFCAVTSYPTSDARTFPFLNILEETIRNLYYHVPMWFAMMFLLFVSVIYSILHLLNPENDWYDSKASGLAAVGTVFGIIGLVTGMLWAKHTWGAYWSSDVKQNTSAIALLIYLAYFVLRSSFDDLDKRGRIAAIYNIFAFATLIPLLYIIPRMVDSLHPGMGGNPAFSKLDLDNTMRMVFYPAIIGWILMGMWMSQLSARLERLKRKHQEEAF